MMILRFLGIGLAALGGSALVLGTLAARRRRSGVAEPGPADGVVFAGALIGAIALDIGLVLPLLG